MLNLLRCRFINAFVLSASLTCFTLAAVTPASAYSDAIHEAIFYKDLAKAVKKLKKCKDPKKSISALLSLKKLIENAYGININVEGCLMEAQRKAHNEGFDLSNDEMQGLAKLLKIKKLKWLNKAEFINQEITGEELDILLHDLADKAKDTYHNMPGNVVMGVSCLLGAFFLRYIPLPFAKVLSDGLLVVGLTYLSDELADRHNKECEQNKENQQNNQNYYPPEQDGIIFT